MDFAKELKRLEKEREGVAKELGRGEGMLKNAGFLAKAPAQLVENEKAKLEQNRQKLDALDGRIAGLKEEMA